MSTENTDVTILIVDDQPSARDILRGLLQPEGYQITTAVSGADLLKSMDKLSPDTILMDVMMPEMDGFEVCRKLKTHESWQHIPIILITALDSKEDIARGLDAGADDFLSKPVTGLELRARVRSMLRIKQQFDELQATLHLREELAAMIVHDLRNPLTPILGISDLLLLTNNLPEQMAQDVRKINTQAHRLNSYLNDMLMLAKMEEDKLILNRSMVDVNQLVSTIKENHRVIADSRKINLVADLPDKTNRVFMDANLVQRMLDNLISNALKFSNTPGSTVTIKAEYLAPEETTAPPARSPQLRLKVLDEGPGIPQAHKQNVFDKYKIVDLKKTDVPQVGLGLAFCKLVAEAHSGHIRVEDNQPKGAVFTVEL